MRILTTFTFAFVSAVAVAKAGQDAAQIALTLPEVEIVAYPDSLPLERLASAECESDLSGDRNWNGNVALPCVPLACVPAACEEYSIDYVSGALTCYDSDEVFPAGHWTFQDCPDEDNCIQVVTEY